MSHLFKSLILEAKDIGMQKYSVSDVADLMKPKPVRVDPSLKEFGMLVAAVMDQDNDMSKFSVNGRQKNA